MVHSVVVPSLTATVPVGVAPVAETVTAKSAVIRRPGATGT